jgi:putative flippase GtrA
MNSVTNSVLAHWRQFALFLAGGVVTALLDVGLMQLLIAAGVHYAGATTAGFGAALLVNYGFHSRVTFATPATPFNFARYLSVVGLNYLVTMGCVALAVALGAGTLAGKLVSLPLVATNSFLLGKYWIFK